MTGLGSRCRRARPDSRRRDDVKALNLYATALGIDCVDEAPTHMGIAGQLHEHWPTIVGQEEHTLEESKLNLVRRFGEAARTIVERRRREEQSKGLTAEPAYMAMYRISAIRPRRAGAPKARPRAARRRPPRGTLRARGVHVAGTGNASLAAPLLLGSASSKPARWAARNSLERWLQFVAVTDRVPGSADIVAVGVPRIGLGIGWHRV